MLIPRHKTPDLSVPQLGGGTFDLSAQTPKLGTIICFYRGLHCPLCATYLAELDRLTPDFAERGVETFALSHDGLDRTKAMADKIKVQNLRLGYDLPLDVARAWGLYISTSRGKSSIGIEEPAHFSEPGLFMVTPQQSLYYMSVQTMPFVRPHFKDLLVAVDGAVSQGYPARGEFTGPLT